MKSVLRIGAVLFMLFGVMLAVTGKLDGAYLRFIAGLLLIIWSEVHKE